MKPELVVKSTLIFGLLIAVDQLSKYLIRFSGGFYICNKNAAFGIEVPSMVFWLIIGFFLILTISNLKFVIRNSDPCYKLLIANYNFSCVILILSGGLSNIIDRLYFGCVIDFIDLKFWPVFNLADSFIVIGSLILLAKYFKL